MWRVALRAVTVLSLWAAVTSIAQRAVPPLWTFEDILQAGPICVNDDVAYFAGLRLDWTPTVTALHLSNGTVAWSVPLPPSFEYSSMSVPSCSSRSLALTSQVSDVLVLDALTGATRWTRTLSTAVGATVSSALITEGGAVVVATTSHTYALNPANGETVWMSSFSPLPTATGAAKYRFGFTNAHVLFVVVIDNTTSALALRLTNGELDWTASLPGTERGQQVWVSDVRATGDDGGMLLVAFTPRGANSNHIAGLSIADNGQSKWVVRMQNSIDFWSPQISASHGLFVVTALSNAHPFGFNLSCYNASSGELSWTQGPFPGFQRNVYSQPVSPTLSDGVVVFAQLYAVVGLDATRGGVATWQSTPFFSSVNWYSFTRSTRHKLALAAVKSSNTTAMVAAYAFHPIA